MSGSHCLQRTVTSTQGLSATTEIQDTAECVGCFFPNHCLTNSTCLPGTAGPICERCQMPDYQLVGSSCVQCSPVPHSAVMLVVFFIMVVSCTVLSRHLQVAVTKIKILIHFVQLVYLSLFIKVNWSPLIGQLASVLSFSTFTSDIAMTECLLTDVKLSYYLRWLTAAAVPGFFLSLGRCIDKGFGSKIKSATQDAECVRLEMRKHQLRHIIFLILVTYYMPVALSAVQSFSCTATFGKMLVFQSDEDNLFLYDSSVSCEDFLFQTSNFFLTLLVLSYTTLLPLLIIFFTLRQKKWALLECKSSSFGFLYDSYKDGMCYWEALAMIRKVASVGVTCTVLIDPFLQSVVLLSISGFYFLLLLAARPFRNCYWENTSINLHLLLEMVFSVSVCVFHIGALLLSLDMYPAQLDILLLLVLGLAFTLWIIVAVTGRLQVTDYNLQVTVDENEIEDVNRRSMTLIKRNQVGEYVTCYEADHRTAQTEF